MLLAIFVNCSDSVNAERAWQGSIHLVDGKSAELKDLILVRTSKYANWKIDPQIIERLKKPPAKERPLPAERECSISTFSPRHCSISNGGQSSNVGVSSSQLIITPRPTRNYRSAPASFRRLKTRVTLARLTLCCLSLNWDFVSSESICNSLRPLRS